MKLCNCCVTIAEKHHLAQDWKRYHTWCIQYLMLKRTVE